VGRPDLAVAAVDGRDAVPDLPYLPVVVGAEEVQDTMETLVHVLLGVRELRAVDLRYWQEFGYVYTRESESALA
jgi:hypothetical protein